MIVAPNTPERWSDEKCAGLKASIDQRRSFLEQTRDRQFSGSGRTGSGPLSTDEKIERLGVIVQIAELASERVSRLGPGNYLDAFNIGRHLGQIVYGTQQEANQGLLDYSLTVFRVGGYRTLMTIAPPVAAWTAFVDLGVQAWAENTSRHTWNNIHKANENARGASIVRFNVATGDLNSLIDQYNAHCVGR